MAVGNPGAVSFLPDFLHKLGTDLGTATASFEKYFDITEHYVSPTAESRAAAYLMAKGYRILAKRFRTPHGEIDLVAKRRNLISFVEVKARATLDDAAFAVTPRQKARIIDAAQAWLMAHPEHAELELRFDAMLIAPRHLPRHVMAAFDAST